jgi:hypothetical protein
VIELSLSSRRRTATALVVAAVLALGAATVGGSPATAAEGRVGAGRVLRVSVPEAVGGKTVIGQLTVDHATEPGFVVAYGCGDGVPGSADGGSDRSDLNFDGRVTPVASNRLIVQADGAGDVCFYTTRQVDLIIDVNAVSFDVGINSFPNRRTDTRSIDMRPQVAAGDVLRVSVPDAAGGKTVFGQLTADRTIGAGYVTAYGCDDGIPSDANGNTIRSDLNVDGRVNPVASNRLIVQADDDGDICLASTVTTDLIVDVNAVSDVGIVSFPNRRTDTRNRTGRPTLAAGGVTRVNVPEAVGARTVIGQLTVDRTFEAGFVTAYGCQDGLPQEAGGGSGRSDLNFDGRIDPVASNRLIVQADANGDVCFFTSAPADVIVDVNAVSGVGITSFPNRRTDTRSGTTTSEPPGMAAVPEWPPFVPAPPLVGVAALTGAPASDEVARRPIVAVKIDNYRVARPQWGLDQADAIIEENVEGVTRFIALFHSRLPRQVGPVRSARTGDLDMLAGMNRPIFGYSGANEGVSAWIASAAGSGVLVDFTAQRRPCYARTADRPGPHNLLLDAPCAVETVRTGGGDAGPAGRLWAIDPAWTPPVTVPSTPDTTFLVPMDGVVVEWTWNAATRSYLRSQDGVAHVAVSGAQISAQNVVEISSQHVPSPVDARSPNPITVGAGNAVVHRDGRAIPVTWSRPSPHDPFTFIHPTTGTPVPLDRGVTFVELVRAG